MTSGSVFFVRRGLIALSWAIFIFLGSCTAPLSVQHLSLDASYAQVDRSALEGNVASASTMIVLRRHGLLNVWNTNPDAAIAMLRQQVVGQPELWRELFALAELSYLRGKQQNSQADFLGAAVYAYAFLDPGNTQDQPSPFDERFRQACNIYNFALTQAFATHDSGPIQIVSGQYALPFGVIELDVNQSQLTWHGRALVNFAPTATLSVSGLQNLYRNPGLGEPLAAAPEAVVQPDVGFVVAPKLRVPANLLLLIDAPRHQLAQSRLVGQLSVHTIDVQQSVVINGQSVPLEYDQTATRALSLAEAVAWSNEYKGFLNGALFDQKHVQLVALEPHQYGHMPVILVHGTASSPFRWADMVNDLLEDPEIRDHFEFWFFSYGTGNPIPYSALQLRQSIEQAVAQLGGVKADPALGKMTLIGHSQGGLLTKMLVINPGDQLWNGVSTKPLDALKLSDKSRALLLAGLFPTPLPEVQRVVFIATPQRGSYVAGFSISHLIGRLVRLPLSVTEVAKDIVTGNGTSVLAGKTKMRLGSINGMSPNSPFIQTLAAIPVVPGVHVHSIIPVATNGPLSEATDGVVAYSSAHIEPVDSELIVHSGHSTQSTPETIAEVRRILLLQLKASGYASSVAAVATQQP
jgi:pimeloyl-ACP methyl ester carboxylesterase